MVPVIRTEACNLEEWLCASGTTGLKSAAPCRQDCLREVQMLITLALGPASLALAPRRPAGRRQPRCPRAVSWPSGLPRAPPHTDLWAAVHTTWLSSNSSPFPPAQWGHRCPPSSRHSLTASVLADQAPALRVTAELPVGWAQAPGKVPEQGCSLPVSPPLPSALKPVTNQLTSPKPPVASDRHRFKSTFLLPWL